MPTAEERAGMARVVGLAALEDIQLLRLQCSRAPTPPAEGERVVLDISVKGRHETADKKLTAEISFRMRTIPASAEADAVFLLRYALAAEVADADAASFTKYNAVFNAWPYWRELVQSVALRMGLAPLTIPLLRA